MIGIDKFKEYFTGHEVEYVIIGGTACELLMSADELQFRATKDIDMVLIVELITKEFAQRFWEFIINKQKTPSSTTISKREMNALRLLKYMEKMHQKNNIFPQDCTTKIHQNLV